MKTRRALGAFVAAAVLGTAAWAHAQGMPGAAGSGMPDAKQMSGLPLPVGDVAPGTITVRVLRGSLTSPIAGQPVELRGQASQKSTTNETGRAEFTGVPAGARVKAVAVVGSERLESQEFQVPASGGIRVMLVATDPEAAKLAQAPPQPGSVVLGDQSRFVFEFNDEGMSVFNILQIQNGAPTPVQTAPLVFDLPEAAESAALLDGSSPQASLAGKRVTITGPFAPGMTLVQFAYSMHYGGDVLTIQQKLPAPMTQLTVLAQKVGETHLTSPQMSDHREMAAEGQTYIVGQGPGLKAGDVVTFNFTGLPHSPMWPRNLALALAAAILIAGAWGSLRRAPVSPEADTRRRKLEGRRDRLFADLTALEERHRAGQVDPRRYADQRRDLVTALERVYAELDEEAAA